MTPSLPTHALSQPPARRMRAAALAILALGLALVLLQPPEPAQASKNLEVAIQDDAVFRHRSYYDLSRAFEQTRRLEVTWMRVVVPWSTVLGADASKRSRPSNPSYDWSQFDRLVDDAAANGIKVQMVLTGDAPAFATSNKRISEYRPNGRRYGEFVRAAATHFKGRVSRYSIWNEPNWHSWLNGPGNVGAGKTYRSLYKAGYSAIKRVDPAAQVLFGETAPYYQRRKAVAPLQFMRDALCLDRSYRRKRGCGPLKADGFAHHPYEFRNGPSYRFPGADNVTMGTLSRLRSALSRVKRSGTLTTPSGGTVPIYLTEWGYFASGSRRISDSRRATYTKQAFDIARRTPGVRQLLQYLLVKPPAGSAGSGFNTGIVNLSGSETRPYRALRDWVRANRSRISRNPLNTP